METNMYNPTNQTNAELKQDRINNRYKTQSEKWDFIWILINKECKIYYDVNYNILCYGIFKNGYVDTTIYKNGQIIRQFTQKAIG